MFPLNFKVIFQLPRNRTWLMENKWVTCDEVIAPFVTSIKVFLPLGDYENVRKEHTITTTIITNDLGERKMIERMFPAAIRWTGLSKRKYNPIPKK